jgi:integrase
VTALALREKNLYQREPGGNWYIRYTVNGRQVKQSTGTTNKKLAQMKLTRIKHEIDCGRLGLPTPKQEITFDELAHQYIEGYAKPNKKSWTRDMDCLLALKCFFGNMPVSKISKYHVEQYRIQRKTGTLPLKSGCQTRKPSAATVNKELTLLGTLFRKAEWYLEADKVNLPIKNPVDGIRKEKENNERVEWLNEDEAIELLDACNPFLRPIVLCALCTGMRRGEILRLKWESVDLDNRLITIRENKSNRTLQVAIPEVLKTELMRMKTRHPGSEFVFISSLGIPYGDVKNPFAHALEQSGIAEKRRQAGKPKFRFHDLRHTFASNLAMSTGNMFMVQKCLGHSSPRVTQRYAHLAESMQQEAVQEMTDKMFERKKLKKSSPEENTDGGSL